MKRRDEVTILGQGVQRERQREREITPRGIYEALLYFWKDFIIICGTILESKKCSGMSRIYGIGNSSSTLTLGDKWKSNMRFSAQSASSRAISTSRLPQLRWTYGTEGVTLFLWQLWRHLSKLFAVTWAETSKEMWEINSLTVTITERRHGRTTNPGMSGMIRHVPHTLYIE